MVLFSMFCRHFFSPFVVTGLSVRFNGINIPARVHVTSSLSLHTSRLYTVAYTNCACAYIHEQYIDCAAAARPVTPQRNDDPPDSQWAR